MQQEDNTDHLGKHQNDVIGLPRLRHTEKDTEDIERQHRDDGCLDSLFDDCAELRKALHQDRRVRISHSDTYHERTHQLQETVHKRPEEELPHLRQGERDGLQRP